MMIFRELTGVQKKAMSFLRRELADGAKHSVAEIRLKAEAEKISYRSLLSAMKILKVEVSKNGIYHFWNLEK